MSTIFTTSLVSLSHFAINLSGSSLNPYPVETMETAYIALGANIPSPVGTPRQTLDAALLRLAELGHLTAQSSYYETAPVGYSDQPTFLNAAAALETDLAPEDLLNHLLEIERSFGRDRTHGIPNGPRTLDLDLILYGDRILNIENLQLPHPRMAERSFVLLPLAEIAPDRIHPQLVKTMKQLLHDLTNHDLTDQDLT